MSEAAHATGNPVTKYPNLTRVEPVSDPFADVLAPRAVSLGGPGGGDLPAFTISPRLLGRSVITDTDLTQEGWVHACSTPGDCDGSFTVNEPIGAQSWFPCNNHMTDKATFTTSITAPDGYTALGAGELAGTAPTGDDPAPLA